MKAAFDASLEARKAYEDGVTGLKGAFDRDWGPQLQADYEQERAAALRGGTTVNRGPNRFWFPAHPTAFKHFVDIAMLPYVTEVSQAVLGEEYQIVEFGADEPSKGATTQPWHRDRVITDGMRRQGRYDYFVFNIGLRDADETMGPFEIVPGTQFMEEPELQLSRGLFVYRRHYESLEQTKQRRIGRIGDITARATQTIHRGTAHTSATSRPVLVLGAAVPELATPEHCLPVTEQWLDALKPHQQAFFESHVRYQVVKEIGHIATPGTDVEELTMGNEGSVPY